VRAPFLALVLAAAGRSPALSRGAPAQEGTLQLEVRVTSAERGWARIDRGSADGLALGDAVLLHPRGGGPYSGTLVELEERAARVELHDRGFTPAPGTRGKVQVPRGRLCAAPAPRLRPAPKRGAPAPEAPPVFRNQDEEWREGEPLLARVRPVRPAERAPSLHGRSYAILDHARASEDERSDTFARTGTSLVLENPFRRGGRLQADAEWNYRRVDVPDLDDEEDVELRLERLSYAWGGTRFAPSSWEVGRFLQGGMPELGVLDGVEWIARRSNGHRYGASLGFQPEPDEEFQTGSDLQVAAFYRWVVDESEQLSAAAGFQKTFHDGAADRDLVVLSASRLPRRGWSLLGTAWIDAYSDGDDRKGTLLGLTQAYLSAGRRFAGGSSLDLAYGHREFPELERDEFLPVEDAQLADDHADRLALTSRLALGRDARLLTALGGWIDEDDEGGDAELGLSLQDAWGERGFADLAVFGGRGRFERSLGTRLSLGRSLASGRLALDYELAQHRLDGFSSANDDLPQHRLRFSGDHALGRWSVSWRVEGLLYDDENAIQAGLYLQRSHY
jgi:hypothetical protein